MSQTDQHSAAGVLLESEQETFFKLLLHDDRNSFYVVSTDRDGLWADAAFKANSLPSLPLEGLSNYYVTHNGFTGKKRSTKRIRQVNALFFDIDFHASSVSSCAAQVMSALARIDDAVDEGRLPRPTLAVDSGRGIHLYYVLKRSLPYRFRGSGEVNEKGLALFERVQGQLASVLEEALAGLDGVVVDRAVFDHTRVSRIPGTFNAKAGRFARLVRSDGCFYHLPDLEAYKPRRPRREPAKRRATMLSFNPLMMARLAKVAELQEHRGYDCEGSRELMCFVFYNTAVQVYRRADAQERLSSFNARFTAPLPKAELDGVVRSVDAVVNVKGERGHYVIKAATLADMLSMTEQEMAELSFFSSKKTIDRMEAKKRTRERREARNQRIVELYRAGGRSQAQVAVEVGCSPRTVHAALREAGLTGRRGQRRVSKRRLVWSWPLRVAAAGDSKQAAAEGGAIMANVFANFCPPCLGSEWFSQSIAFSRFDARGLRPSRGAG